MRKLDLTGQKFGRLTAIEIVGKTKHGLMVWRCRCECGNYSRVPVGALRGAAIRSCGCLAREGNHLTHGQARKGKVCREWIVWQSAKNRCFNPSTIGYLDYGGRGIKMCERWKNSFEAFLEDMGRCPVGKVIDRINNDGDYKPGNCRWATTFEQNNNKRNVPKITHDGKTLTKSEWDLERGYPIGTVARRIFEGCSVEKALTMSFKGVRK